MLLQHSCVLLQHSCVLLQHSCVLLQHSCVLLQQTRTERQAEAWEQPLYPAQLKSKCAKERSTGNRVDYLCVSVCVCVAGVGGGYIV